MDTRASYFFLVDLYNIYVLSVRKHIYDALFAIFS